MRRFASRCSARGSTGSGSSSSRARSSRCRGLDLWEERGQLVFRASVIERAGVGDQLAALERLKRALAAEGLFAEGRKRALPGCRGRSGWSRAWTLPPVATSRPRSRLGSLLRDS